MFRIQFRAGPFLNFINETLEDRHAYLPGKGREHPYDYGPLNFKFR